MGRVVINFEHDTPEQARDAMARLLGINLAVIPIQAVPSKASDTPTPGGAPVVSQDTAPAAEQPQQEAVESPKKPGKRKAPPQTIEATATDVSDTPIKPPTIEDVRNKLKAYHATFGTPDDAMTGIQDMLGQFGAKKASELKEVDYPKIIAAIDAAMKGGAA